MEAGCVMNGEPEDRMDKWNPRPVVWGTVAILLAGGDAMLDSFKGDNGIDAGAMLKVLQSNSTEASTYSYVEQTIQGPNNEVTPPNRSNGVVLVSKRLPRHQL